MKCETRLIWVLGITFGFVFFDRNAVNFLMRFIAADLHFTNQQIGCIASALSLTWGIAAGPILPVSQSLVAFESAVGRRGFNMGVMQNFGSNLLGSFAAPPVLVAVATAHTWRTAFFVAGVPGLIMAAIFSFVVPGLSDRPGPRPRRARVPRVVGERHHAPVDGNHPIRDDSRPLRIRSLRSGRLRLARGRDFRHHPRACRNTPTPSCP